MLSVAIAGWLLSCLMLAFGDILVVIGVHVGWNYAQALLTSERFWSYEESDSVLLSGGRFGLEASLPGIVITALAAATCLLLFLRRSADARFREGGRGVP